MNQLNIHSSPTGPVVKHAQFLDLQDKAAKADPDDIIRFVASTEAVDRYGDIVRADGWKLDNYRKNPVVLFGHAHNTPVGLAQEVEVRGKALHAGIKLAEEGSGQVVDYVRALVAQGILRAVSVSFLPLKWNERFDEAPNGRKQFVGYEYTEQELLEISIVSVPANQEALRIAKSMRVPDELCARLLLPKALSHHRARLELLRLAEHGHQ